ncbi:telomerase Cajal body protein 1-like [Augochlora pura]
MQLIDSATEIWTSFKNALRIFNMKCPGPQITTIHLNPDFLKTTGLVSCNKEIPVMSGLVAFDTYAKHIGFYKNGPLCSLKTGSGVTQIEFSPCGTKLFSAVSCGNEFLCWDLRNTGGTDGNIAIWELSESASDTNLNLTHKIKTSNDCINVVSS